jgi:hypothetical protein
MYVANTPHINNSLRFSPWSMVSYLKISVFSVLSVVNSLQKRIYLIARPNSK